MRKIIYKFPICSVDYGDSITSVTVPLTAELLKIAPQYNTICAWYLVDPEEIDTREDRWYQIGTGHEYDFNGLTYIDSVINEEAGLVWHMFMETL